MAEDSAFWGGTTVGDAASADVWQAPYTSEEWSDIWSKMFASDSTSGFVVPLHDNELAVEAEDPASMDVSVLSGVAVIRGRLYENTTTASLTIAANASGNPRIDRVILSTDFAAQTIRLDILQGTPGATPALPALTQDANTWEVSLAYIWVANGAATIPNEEIHDERLFLKTSLSHKYEAGSQNLIKNSEFMGFSELSGGATTNPPDGWDLVSTPSDIASATKYSGMPRGRAVQVTANGANEGISQTASIGSSSPCALKASVNVTAGDVGVIEADTYAELAEYPTTNQNISVPLRGPSGAGATTTVQSTSDNYHYIGNSGGNNFWSSQGFQVTAGILSQFTVYFDANSGSPSGTVIWEVQTDNAGSPSGTVLQTGTFTPTPSSNNTIPVTDGVFLAAATAYHLVLRSSVAQGLNIYWSWAMLLTGTYANGAGKFSTDGGSSWSMYGAEDMRCTITTVAVSVRDKLSQSFQIDSTINSSSTMLLLKKVGAPAGTMTLRIETNNAGSPSGNLVDANATATIAENTLTTSYTQIEFIFAGIFSLSASTTYWLVLSTDRVASATNYVLCGADDSPAYADGEMKSEAGAVWSSENKDACFLVIFSVQLIKYIRRTGAFIEEYIYTPPSSETTVKLMCQNNGDVVKFGQCLLLEGRHPGPFREIHETVLFKDGITDSNWAADAKSDGTTTIDLDADFQALVLPGTKNVLLVLTAKDAQATPTSSLAARKKSSTMDQIKVELTTAITNKNYSCQGWVALNSNQFDLYVIDTIASSVISTAVIIGIDI